MAFVPPPPLTSPLLMLSMMLLMMLLMKMLPLIDMMRLLLLSPICRSFGDVSLRRFGVTSDPDLRVNFKCVLVLSLPACALNNAYRCCFTMWRLVAAAPFLDHRQPLVFACCLSRLGLWQADPC